MTETVTQTRAGAQGPQVPKHPTAPGWPEILAGAVAYLLALLVVALTLPLIENQATAGIVGLFVSGAIGLLALAVAAQIRHRGRAPVGGAGGEAEP